MPATLPVMGLVLGGRYVITHLKPGTTFANVYEVLELIAEGGMGAVYKVRNKELGSYLALKVMQSGLIRDQRMIERFVREAKTTASIESDHVVKVTDAGTWQPPDDARQPAIPYYVMELLDGQTLSRTIQDGGPFSWSRANQFFRELCHALVAAHARQIVHRDLKPDNILLAKSRSADETPRVKVLDFGIAKAVADAKLPGTVAGTPLWMSPEQSQGGKIGFQTDVWALGLIAFYVLTGHYYWTSTDGYVGPEDLQRIERASKRAARYGCAHLIPDGFDVWFSRCVTIKPEARWADAEEARTELLKLMEESVSVQSGESLSAPSQVIRPQRASESAPSRIPAPRLPSSKPYFWRGLWSPYVRLAVAALFLIGVTVLLTVLATKRPPPDAAPVPVSSSTVVPPIAMPQSSGVSVSAAGPAPLPNSTRVQLRVGFLYPGSPNDHGWTATHEAGRIWVERELKQELGATQVVTFYEHTVSEADAPEKIRRMIEQKQANVIVGASDNFRVALLEQASLHSEVRFLICSGFHASTNTGSFFGRMYQAKYLAGQIAGRATFTRRIGYVGAKPNPETISHLNAFTIGVRQQSPTAHVHVKWINDWFNPSLEKEYTTLLVKTGADIIVAGTDTTVPVETAAKLFTPDQERDGKTIIGSGKPVYSIGYGSIDACSRSNRCLTAPYWNWGPLYKRMLLSIYDHSWDRLSNDHKIIWEQIKTNHEESVVNLAPISPLRNLDTGFQIRIGEISAQMAKDDELHKHFPFVADSVKIDGRRIMSDSKYLSDEQIRRMCWFVDGVVDDKGMRPESPPGCPGDSKPPEMY